MEEIMFKHILLPTDGSPLSEKAVLEGVRLAKTLGAKVTGFHVAPEFHVFDYRADVLSETREQYRVDSRARALEYLRKVTDVAREAGVPCDTHFSTDDQPYEAIIRTAEEQGCDLIMMASHGRRGVQALLMGSETQKVLTHSKIPVLVYR